jgi:hypothetical protein
MLPQNCNISNCAYQSGPMNLPQAPFQPVNYVYPMFQPVNYGYQPQPTVVDTEINNLKSEILQLKYQLSSLKEIADQQLESIKMLVNKVEAISQPQFIVKKRKSEVSDVEILNKRIRQPVNYNQIHSGNSPKQTIAKPVVEISDEVENTSSLDLSELLEKTNEEMFEDGDYYVDKKKTNVVAATNSNNWIVYVDFVTTNKDTGQKVITQKKMALASDLFDHIFSCSSYLSALINKKLKKSVHFIRTNVPYFNCQRLLLTGKGIEELVNILSLKGHSFDPKDMAVWKGMIEELK